MSGYAWQRVYAEGNKMQRKNSTSSGGMTLGGTLALIFVVLKLTGMINWSWIWVLSPIWISIFLFVVLVFILHLIFGSK
jgi:CBS domain containing-hemolysin-like protein